MNFLQLTKNEIPFYLHNSDFYKMLDSNDSFEIPKHFFEEILVINTYDDLVKYLVIFNFWGLEKLPFEVYEYIYTNKKHICINDLKLKFADTYLLTQIQFIIENVEGIYIHTDKDIVIKFTLFF